MAQKKQSHRYLFCSEAFVDPDRFQWLLELPMGRRLSNVCSKAFDATKKKAKPLSPPF